MQTVLPCTFLVLALSAAPLASQNFVTNGDFSGGLTGWTEAGFSVNPMVESFDTTGLGASQAYGCNPGGQVTPGPYPPNSIEQSVTLAAGVPYEFTAEIHVSRVAAVGNADAGTFWVEVGGVEVTRTALGGYLASLPQRARLCEEEQKRATESVKLVLEQMKSQLADSRSKLEQAQKAELDLRMKQEAVEA